MSEEDDIRSYHNSPAQQTQQTTVIWNARLTARLGQHAMLALAGPMRGSTLRLRDLGALAGSLRAGSSSMVSHAGGLVTRLGQPRGFSSFTAALGGSSRLSCSPD